MTPCEPQNIIIPANVSKDMARPGGSGQSLSGQHFGSGTCLYAMGTGSTFPVEGAIYIPLVSWLDSKTRRLGAGN